MTSSQLQAKKKNNMTYWVVARDSDGMTFIGTVAGMEGRRLHHWIQIDASTPHKITFEGIPVIVFKLVADGPVAIEPFWGRAKLKLNKHWRATGHAGRHKYVRSVKLHVTHGNTLWAHSWGPTGQPNLINSPGDHIFPRSHRRCLNATIMQVGLLRHIYSTARHVRLESEQIAATKEEQEEEQPRALKNTAELERGRDGDGERPHKSRNLPG